LIVLLASGSNSTSTLNDVEPGLLGFLVVAALAVALVFLLRSMNKQFRKIGPPPEDPADIDAALADAAQADEAQGGVPDAVAERNARNIRNAKAPWL
jgi:hypothetical protein